MVSGTVWYRRPYFCFNRNPTNQKISSYTLCGELVLIPPRLFQARLFRVLANFRPINPPWRL